MRDADEESFEVRAAQSRSLRHPDTGEADAASAVDGLPAIHRTVSRRKCAASEKEAIVCRVSAVERFRFMMYTSEAKGQRAVETSRYNDIRYSQSIMIAVGADW